MIPKESNSLDHEVEIAVVIGKKAKYVNEKNAQDYILGYCICNDISERDLQKNRGGQWVKGKSGDTFGPLGPYLVTKDEIEDPFNLNLSLDNIIFEGNSSLFSGSNAISIPSRIISSDFIPKNKFRNSLTYL